MLTTSYGLYMMLEGSTGKWGVCGSTSKYNSLNFLAGRLGIIEGQLADASAGVLRDLLEDTF